MSTCSRAATAGGVPRFHFWLIAMGQQRTSATSRCSSRAKPASRFMSPPSATRPACLPRPKRRKMTVTSHRLKAHILDDGFQHRQLARDIDILLLSRADLTDQLLPAGNLREALLAAKRADVIAIPADEPDLEEEIKSRGWQGINLAPAPPYGNPARLTAPVAAFCGIARPDAVLSGTRSGRSAPRGANRLSRPPPLFGSRPRAAARPRHAKPEQRHF